MVDGIDQVVYPVDRQRKRELLSRQIATHDWKQALVFTREGQEDVIYLPTRQGLSFGVVLVLMFVGAVNYQASLAFAVVFLLANLAAFHMTYEDLQVRETAGLNIFTTNADATINGYETSLRWRPDGGFDLAASYAYTDATFDEYVLPSADYSGNRLTRSPKHKVTLTPSYTAAIGSGAELEVAVDYQFESKIWDDASNSGPEFRQHTHILDARAIFTARSRDWSLALWGKNLTNEVTRTHQATFIGANFASYNPPRTYGLTLRWNY